MQSQGNFNNYAAATALPSPNSTRKSTSPKRNCLQYRKADPFGGRIGRNEVWGERASTASPSSRRRLDALQQHLPICLRETDLHCLDFGCCHREGSQQSQGELGLPLHKKKRDRGGEMQTGEGKLLRQASSECSSLREALTSSVGGVYFRGERRRPKRIVKKKESWGGWPTKGSL